MAACFDLKVVSWAIPLTLLVSATNKMRIILKEECSIMLYLLKSYKYIIDKYKSLITRIFLKTSDLQFQTKFFL